MQGGTMIYSKDRKFPVMFILATCFMFAGLIILLRPLIDLPLLLTKSDWYMGLTLLSLSIVLLIISKPIAEVKIQ